jgi:hypothetical protein
MSSLKKIYFAAGDTEREKEAVLLKAARITNKAE